MSKVKRATVISLLVLGAGVVGIVAMAIYERGYSKFVVGNTSSMSPTINSGELIFVKRVNLDRDSLRRYYIVAFRSPLPGFSDKTWVMRVVGLPGEHLEIGTNSLLINHSEVAESDLPSTLRNKQWLTPQILEASVQHQWTLGPNEVFVVGDNLSTANDSRFWGPLNLSKVIGVVEQKAKGKRTQMDLNPLPIRATFTTQDGHSEAVDTAK